MAAGSDASDPSAQPADPAAALANAVRDLAREVNRQPPATTTDAHPFRGRELFTLALLVLDLALLALVFQSVLESPLAKALGTVAPILFSGAVVGWREQLRDLMQRLAGRRLTWVVGLLLIASLGAVLIVVPVPIRTDGSVTVQLDSVARLSPGDTVDTLKVHGLRVHTLQVEWADTVTGVESELHLDLRDLFGGLVLAAGAVARPGKPPAYSVAPLIPVNVHKPRGIATLQLTAAPPYLLRRELGRTGWSVQRADSLWLLTHALVKDRNDSVLVAGGSVRTLRLVTSTGVCESDIRSITPGNRKINFGDSPCPPARVK